MILEENNKISKSNPEVQMSFLDHFEELRGRIIKVLIGLFIGTILSFSVVGYIINILTIPAHKVNIELQNIKPFGQLSLYFQISLLTGLILSLPNVFYQIWKFIFPALKEKERKYIVGIVFFSTFSFLVGIVFAYFVMMPMTFAFLASFNLGNIKNQFSIDEYIDLVFSLLLACGLIFEMPMISFFLSKIGILTPQFLSKYRRHAIIVLMIAAAFLSPGTDPVSQVVLAIPLFLLYELSILVSKWVVKH